MRKFTILLAAALAAGALEAQAPRRAPGFSLPDSKMALHDLADFRGKPVILEFMLTTCPHCETLSGILERLRAKYGDRIAILGVVNPPDNQSKVDQFIADQKIGYPIVFDCGQAAYSYVLSRSFTQPALFLIDRGGMIRRQFTYGDDTKAIFEGDGLAPEVEKLLKK